MSHGLHVTHQRAVQTIHGLAIRYRLAIIGPRIDVVHSGLGPTLPLHSIGVRDGEVELLIDSAEWIERRADLDSHVLSWPLEHIDFGGAPRGPALQLAGTTRCGCGRGGTRTQGDGEAAFVCQGSSRLPVAGLETRCYGFLHGNRKMPAGS